MTERKALADQPIIPEKLTEVPTSSLIELAAAKDQKSKETGVELDFIKAELQRRAENDLDEKNIKFTEFFGSQNSYVNVSVAQKLEIMNLPRIKELLGQELIEDKIREKQLDKRYEYDKAFKQALIAVITGDYDHEFTIEQIIDRTDWELDEQQRSLILKKLKGEYARDRKTLLTILGKPDLDIDVELYYIYKIKNWERIRAFFPEENFQELAEEIQKYVIVDETPKIELKYC